MNRTSGAPKGRHEIARGVSPWNLEFLVNSPVVDILWCVQVCVNGKQSARVEKTSVPLLGSSYSAVSFEGLGGEEARLRMKPCSWTAP